MKLAQLLVERVFLEQPHNLHPLYIVILFRGDSSKHYLIINPKCRESIGNHKCNHKSSRPSSIQEIEICPRQLTFFFFCWEEKQLMQHVASRSRELLYKNIYIYQRCCKLYNRDYLLSGFYKLGIAQCVFSILSFHSVNNSRCLRV